jgi:hypothetical protein
VDQLAEQADEPAEGNADNEDEELDDDAVQSESESEEDLDYEQNYFDNGEGDSGDGGGDDGRCSLAAGRNSSIRSRCRRRDGLNVIHLKDGICLASVLMRASDDDDHFVAEARSLSTVLALSAPMTFGDSS